MICPNCKNEIDDNSEFCPLCGKDISVQNDQNNNMQKNDNNEFDTAIYLPIGILFIFIVSIVLLICSNSSNYNDYSDNSSNIESLFCFIGVIILFLAIVFCKKIKNVVLKVARFLLDFSTTLDALLGVSILIVGIFVCNESSGMIPYWWFVVGAFLYTLIALVKDYALYLLIDIRDSLKILSDKAKKEEKENMG